ncbi:GTPase IMAP family member 7-like [Colossoma macropomum]|uniref:GTPase IMAP family member 7-like n=1 Tax=Colossoma macropomum TaxID=42526 RepID=UPI001864D115|nr:GTPase IMAP family member 7-like [Colossoma macropomum]
MTEVDIEHSEKFPYALRSSVDPKEECRLILLGGDKHTKHDAYNFILRTEDIGKSNNSVYENYIKGRHVSVLDTPSVWRDHLASFWFFSRKLNQIKHELQDCISKAFPGPHAFLLVLQAGRDTRKERYLLKAISSVFGKEALDYTMVLFIYSGQNSQTASKNSYVRRCGNRYHFLENTDQSVQELFRKVEKMTDVKQSKFFIPSSYENYMKLNFESWEKKRLCRGTTPVRRGSKELIPIDLSEHQRRDSDST